MPMKSPPKRSQPDFSRESPDLGIVCGIDEAGRGPLAGPVVAGCVYVPPESRGHPVWSAVRDSKKLTAARRDDLFSSIMSQSCHGIGFASVDEIDEINILQATYLAMTRAYDAMLAAFPHALPDMALIDGNRAPKLSCDVRTVVKGDALSISIGAASILAKVTRDRLMEELHASYPVYGWDGNAGYGTPGHLEALRQHGPCPHHRKSFEPIKSNFLASKAA